MAKRNNSQDHLRTEHYRAARDFTEGPGMLARRLLDHLSEVCATCNRYWQQLGALREVMIERIEALILKEEPRLPAPREWSVTAEDMDRQKRETAELRRRRRRSWEQKSELLGTPLGKRVALIRNSKRRFQSSLLAEALFEDGKKLTTRAPQTAAHLFSLIPEVLRNTGIESGSEQSWNLMVRAKSWHANALRIAGDLQGAEACFAAGAEDLKARPVLDTWTLGERTSMEASLAMEQMRLDDAESHLQNASFFFSMTDDAEAQARVMIQEANLESRRQHPAVALDRFEASLKHLEGTEDLRLLGQAVTGKIKVLCDLGRADEARALLEAHVDCFELVDESEGGIYYRTLMGRISLVQKSYLEAEECFVAVVEAFLALDRAYDATLAALDLAETYLLAGKGADLHALSGTLLKRLARHGVSEKTEEAVLLLRQSIARERLTLALLTELRTKLKAHRPT